MGLNRRALLKGALVTGATAAVGSAGPLEARQRREPETDAVGLLYDATKCIGCRACMVACREANGLAPESSSGLWDDPVDLSANTKTVIKLAKLDDGRSSFFKAQCMHCVDPACVSVCMLGALHKGPQGVVEYDVERCIGCRYCQVACAFGIPKFQWSEAAPKIVKCELCKERRAEGKEPGCASACPTGAVIFGKRSELLAEAKRRLAEGRERYVQKVYGEDDGGGTQVLYLSAVPFEELGLPKLTSESLPRLSEAVQHAIYQGFVAPVALYGLLAGVLFRNRRKGDGAEADEGKETNS
ncbi:MAG TPA: hydrogenase 2 operon protein HybA [Candidatus Limnocylindria bacterium]|nr:hydrogenase 2 operon protein HybA [Candidatus Limnocylindria bacterium]